MGNRLLKRLRFYEDECLRSMPDEHPVVFYLLVRTYEIWQTPKGHIKRKMKRTVQSASGETEQEAKVNLSKLIHSSGLRSLPPEFEVGEQLRAEPTEGQVIN
jgi:hypothetical protein